MSVVTTLRKSVQKGICKLLQTVFLGGNAFILYLCIKQNQKPL